MQELLDAKWGDEFAEGLAYCSQMEMVRGVEVVDNDLMSFPWKAENSAFGHLDRLYSRTLKGRDLGIENSKQDRQSAESAGDARSRNSVCCYSTSYSNHDYKVCYLKSNNSTTSNQAGLSYKTTETALYMHNSIPLLYSLYIAVYAV